MIIKPKLFSFGMTTTKPDHTNPKLNIKWSYLEDPISMSEQIILSSVSAPEKKESKTITSKEYGLMINSNASKMSGKEYPKLYDEIK